MCELNVFLHSELLHQLLNTQQWTMAMMKLQWSYETLLEPLFYPVWNICHCQYSGRSWITTPSLQMNGTQTPAKSVRWRNWMAEVSEELQNW